MSINFLWPPGALAIFLRSNVLYNKIVCNWGVIKTLGGGGGAKQNRSKFSIQSINIASGLPEYRIECLPVSRSEFKMKRRFTGFIKWCYQGLFQTENMISRDKYNFRCIHYAFRSKPSQNKLASWNYEWTQLRSRKNQEQTSHTSERKNVLELETERKYFA